jgi:hypothetical protein
LNFIDYRAERDLNTPALTNSFLITRIRLISTFSHQPLESPKTLSSTAQYQIRQLTAAASTFECQPALKDGSF